MDKFWQWLGATKAWEWFAHNVIGRMKIRFVGYTEFPIETGYWEIIDIIKEEEKKKSGLYAFASSDQGSIAGWSIKWLTKDEHTHAGWILPNGDRNTFALHMKGDGVHHEGMLKVCKESDYVTIVKIELEEDKLKIAKDRLQYILDNKEKIAYDFAQLIQVEDIEEAKNIYCSELVYLVLKGLLELKTEKILGRESFDPESVTQLGRIIYSNNKNYSPK
jgi:hypothetical protein